MIILKCRLTGLRQLAEGPYQARCECQNCNAVTIKGNKHAELENHFVAEYYSGDMEQAMAHIADLNAFRKHDMQVASGEVEPADAREVVIHEMGSLSGEWLKLYNNLGRGLITAQEYADRMLEQSAQKDALINKLLDKAYPEKKRCIICGERSDLMDVAPYPSKHDGDPVCHNCTASFIDSAVAAASMGSRSTIRDDVRFFLEVLRPAMLDRVKREPRISVSQAVLDALK